MSARQNRITSKPVSYNLEMASNNAIMGLEPFPRANVTASTGACVTAPEPPPPPLKGGDTASKVLINTPDNPNLSFRMAEDNTDGRGSPAPSLRAGATAQNFQQVTGGSTIGSITSSLSGHNIETLETLSRLNRGAFHRISHKIIKKYESFSRGLKNIPKDFQIIVLSVDTTKVGLEALDMFLQVLEQLDEIDDDLCLVETQKTSIVSIQSILNAYLTEFESIITQKELDDQIARSKRDPNYIPPTWGEESLDSTGSHAEGDTELSKKRDTIHLERTVHGASDITGSHAQGDTELSRRNYLGTQTSTIVPNHIEAIVETGIIVEANCNGPGANSPLLDEEILNTRATSNAIVPGGGKPNSVNAFPRSHGTIADATAHTTYVDKRPPQAGQGNIVNSSLVYNQPYYQLTYGIEENQNTELIEDRTSTQPQSYVSMGYQNFGARPKNTGEITGSIDHTLSGLNNDHQTLNQLSGQQTYNPLDQNNVQVEQQQILQDQQPQVVQQQVQVEPQHGSQYQGTHVTPLIQTRQQSQLEVQIEHQPVPQQLLEQIGDCGGHGYDPRESSHNEPPRVHADQVYVTHTQPNLYSIQNAQVDQQQILQIQTGSNVYSSHGHAPPGSCPPEDVQYVQHTRPVINSVNNAQVQQRQLPQVPPQQTHATVHTHITQNPHSHKSVQSVQVSPVTQGHPPFNSARSTQIEQYQRQLPQRPPINNEFQREQGQSIPEVISYVQPEQRYVQQMRRIPQVQTNPRNTFLNQGQTVHNGTQHIGPNHQQLNPRLRYNNQGDISHAHNHTQPVISQPVHRQGYTEEYYHHVPQELNDSYEGPTQFPETRTSNWKEYRYQGNNIQAIMLNDTMVKIQEIVDNHPSSTTPDLMIKAMDTRDVPQLKEMRSAIMKACKDLKLENEDQRLSQYAAEAFRAAGKYIDAVDKEIRIRELHILADNKKVTPLQLKKFDGFKSNTTNVYEFLQQFEVVTRGMLEKDMKEYLFQNYLSDELQNEVRHLRHSFALIKNALIKRYGNLNTLIREKKTQLKALPQPNFRSNKLTKANYLKSFKEVLDQLKTLVLLNRDKYPEMEREIYNSNRVMELASVMPDYYKSLFSQTLIDESNLRFQEEDLPGEDTFNLLVKFLRDQARILEINITSLSTGEEKHEDPTPPKKKTVNYAGGSKTDQRGSKPNKGNTKRTYDPNLDTWRVACCFMHPHIIRKVSDCLSGKCDLFLQAHPSERTRMAIKKGICTLCLLFKCKIKAPNGPCGYKGEIAKSLVCQPCALNKTDTNVLMCSDHKNDSKQVRKELVKFLPGFEETTSIQIFMMGTYAPNAPIVLKTAEHTAPTTFKVRENKDAFNLTEGTLVPQQDILHKIHNETKHNPMYLLQTLSFAGTPVLTLYDTGASGECIKVEVAEKCKLAIVDPTPQYICVATGSVVPTGGCIYKAVIGPDTNGHYHSITMTGMNRITENIPNYDLTEMIKDLQTNQMSTPLSKEKLPLNAGGDEVGMIIGIKQSRLIPNLELVLPNGLQVWRSKMKDIYDSDLIFSGPHYSITDQDKSSNRINIMFDSLYNSYKDSLYSDLSIHPGSHKTCLSMALQPQQGLNLPTPVDFMTDMIAEDTACHKHDTEPYKDGCTCTAQMYTNVQKCACCTPDPTPETKLNTVSTVNLHLLSTQERLTVKPLDTQYTDESTDKSEPLFVPEFNEKLLFIHLGVPILQESTSTDENNALKCISTLSPLTKPTEILKTRAPKTIEQGLKEQEEAGCKVDYRCPDCQDCTTCKTSDKTRDLAVRDILDDQVIDAAITIDVEAQTTYCSYPWVKDPDKYLREKWHGRSDNKHVAIKVFEQQTHKSEEIRKGTLKFHKEILDKGFAIKLSDLPEHDQTEITTATLLNFFTWRTMEKPMSPSTPIRMVVDPSMSGFNDTIAKGSSCLNSLYEIMVNWRTYSHVFTSDLAKMYNTVKLTKPMYRYSQYLFSENLMPGEEPEIHVMTSLFYGLKSAANICTSSLRKVASLKEADYPKGAEVLKKRTYMDDSGHGANTRENLNEIIEEIKAILPIGGFKLKVVCISGEDPPEAASPDGVTSTFCGYCWYVKDDLLALNHSTINFNVKKRGAKKPYNFPVETDEEVENLLISQKLTRRKLLGKCLEVYDLLGIFEPLKARLKLDLQLLKTLDYDEEIPIEHKPRWEDNLKIINNARHLRCKRAVVPENAVNPDQMHLLCCSDAAKDMAGAAIYARFLLTDQTYSVQLITGKSRTVNSTIPRNELEAALLASETLFVLSKALEDRLASYILVIDSEVALYWISNLEIKLKSFVFNRVRSIHRLVAHEKFFHVKGEDNPSDILTRGNVTLEDLSPDSRWFNGDPWMKLPEEQMIKDHKIRSCDSIRSKISENHSEDINKEMVRPYTDVNQVNNIDLIVNPTEILVLSEQGCIEGRALNTNVQPTDTNTKVYKTDNQGKTKCVTLGKPCEKFLLDPVHYGFKHTLYTLALVYRFITRTKHAVHLKKEAYVNTCHLCELQDTLFKDDGLKRVDTSNRSQLPVAPCLPSSYDLRNAWRFLCLAASTEVREAYTPKKLEPFLDDGTGILKSGGRLSYPDLAQDHTSLPYFQDISFVNPVALYTSKLTLSLCIHMHWNILSHPGVERQISQMLKVLHVPKLRTLVKKYRETCPRCRYLLKKRFSASTGNQTKLALMSCPPFFAAMIDIAGTFLAFDVKSRTTKDAFMLVFNCLTTSAVNIHCMEDMTTESIVMAITRHSKSYGYSKFLLPDNQSSFVILENLRISFRDLQCRLWNNQQIILDFSTPLAHAEHGKVESRIKVLKHILESTAELGKRHSYLQWETVAASITSTMNNLPITHCMDAADLNHDVFGFITPNNMLIGRNQDRAPEGPVDLDAKPSKLLQNIADLNDSMQEILANNIHRYVPGKHIYQGQLPTVGDVCLFLHKENQRSRNCKYKFGKIAAVNVDGRPNKITIKYRNAQEVNPREVDRNIRDVVLIRSINDVDFNNPENWIAQEAQRKYLLHISMR